MAPVSHSSHAWFFRCQYVRTWVAGDFREDAFARQRQPMYRSPVNFQLVATLHQSACAPHSCSPRESLSLHYKVGRSTLAARQEDRRPLTFLFLEVIKFPSGSSLKIKSRGTEALLTEGLRYDQRERKTQRLHDRNSAPTTGRHRVQVETDSVLQSVEEQARVNTRRWTESEERARGAAARSERPIE